MSDNIPDELDAILMRRAAPPASPDLSERIIAAALRRPRRERAGLAGMLDGFFDMFLLPRPAFAMSVFLVAGLTLGFNGDVQSLFADVRDEMVSNYSLVADSYDGGSFL